MSELINTRDSRATIRWKLLASASSLALLGSVYTADAAGTDADRPQIWIELGGQMDNISGQGQPFVPDFLARNPDSPVLGSVTPLQAQRPPKFSFGEEGKISFQPEDSDWVFSAGLRYGRSNNFRHVHHQTYAIWHRKYTSGVPKANQNMHGTDDFAETQVHHRQRHAVLDFSAGKDVGLGMFGKDSSSVVSLGVRFAQFTSKSALDVRARPDLQFKYLHVFSNYFFKLPYFHTYHVMSQSSRSFRGVGPSLSWSGSAPFAGNPRDGEITIDWGANAALLFGKQKAHVRHQEIGHYWSAPANLQNNHYSTPYPGTPGGHTAARSITVPDVGGSLGLSYRYSDAKISLGYRADFFFGAMDTGIDAAKKSNLTFNGPYASISIGLGD